MNNNLMNSDVLPFPQDSRPPVALLIDGENMAAGQIDQILTEVERLGVVTVRWVYGNWPAGPHACWEDAAIHHVLEPKHNITAPPFKNGTDIALVVGAMDLFYSSHIKHFCIVGSDSDYMPLVLRLRSGGCEVWGIGGPDTPERLRNAYSEFVQLSMPLKDVSANELKLADLLKKAYLNVSKLSKGNEWVPICRLGDALYILDSSFKALLGKKILTAVVKERKDLFDTRPGQHGHMEVRLRKQEAEEGFIAA